MVDRVADMSGQREPASGAQHPRQSSHRRSQFGLGKMDDGIPGDDGAPRGGEPRAHEPTEVCDLETEVRRSQSRLLDHPRGHVESAHRSTRLGEEPGDVPRAAPHVGHRVDPRQLRHSRQQPAVERLAFQLGPELQGVCRRDRVVGRRHVHVALGRAAGEDDLPVHDRRGDRSSNGRRQLDRAEQMHPAGVVMPRRLGQLDHQRNLARGEPRQALLDLGAVGKGVQPIGAGLELARRLRAAQQQHGDEGPLVVGELEPLPEELVILQDPVAMHDPHELTQPQTPQTLLDGRLVKVRDRLATGGLVAG